MTILRTFSRFKIARVRQDGRELEAEGCGPGNKACDRLTAKVDQQGARRQLAATANHRLGLRQDTNEGILSVIDLDTTFVGMSFVSAGIGAWSDVRTRRIPNWLTGSSILVGLVLHLVLGGWRSLGSAALAGLLAGAVFLVFHLAGGMGAGDVKLMTAVSVLAGLRSFCRDPDCDRPHGWGVCSDASHFAAAAEAHPVEHWSAGRPSRQQRSAAALRHQRQQ